jgi:hypothetical protein
MQQQSPRLRASKRCASRQPQPSRSTSPLSRLSLGRDPSNWQLKSTAASQRWKGLAGRRQSSRDFETGQRNEDLTKNPRPVAQPRSQDYIGR